MSDTKPGRPPTPEQLDAILDELKAIQRSGVERSYRLGKLVFERFYLGSVEAWRDRRPGKDQSLRSLAERPGCPFSKSALHQAVSIYMTSLAIAGLRYEQGVEGELTKIRRQ